jgi:hypothetical protein
MIIEAEVGQLADRGNRNASQKIEKHLTSSSFISGVIIGLRSALALAAHRQPQPKTKYKHQKADNGYILPRTILTINRGRQQLTTMMKINKGSCWGNTRGIEISNNMVIVRVLLVYGILVAKHMLTALMPCHVNPRFVAIEHYIARAHFCEIK